MRIGVDCRSLQEPQSAGVSVYTRQLLLAMTNSEEAKQHEFVFFVNASGLSRQRTLLNRIQEGFVGTHITWRVHSIPNKLLTTVEVVESRPGFDWMYGDVDVVFFPNIHFLPLTKQRIPFVMTMHDLSFERYPDCLTFKGRLWHRLIKPRVLAENAAKIIAVSSHTKQDLNDLYSIPEDRVEVVYPGLVFEKGYFGSFDLPEKYILSLSTIEPRKNLDALLSAFDIVAKEDPDIFLVIAGSKGWKSERILDRMSAHDRVHYLGYVDEQKKQALLQRAHAFVYPSLYEGFGFPPLEAQAHGVPVLVGSHSSLPEVVGESALLIDVLDARSIARGILHILNDAELRQEYQRRGMENVKRFSWADAARKTFAVLESVGNEKR